MKTPNLFKKSGFGIILSLAIIVLTFNNRYAQKQIIGVLNIEGKGVILNAESLGGLVRIEMEKLTLQHSRLVQYEGGVRSSGLPASW